MSDFTEMYWTRRDEERERAEWEFERWRDAFRCAGPDQPDPPLVVDASITYRHRCAICETILAEFEHPVAVESLKSTLCRECIAWKTRQLNWQRWKLKHDKPKEGVNQ